MTHANHQGEPGDTGWSDLSPQEIVRRTRCEASNFGYATDQMLWRECCDLILNRLGPVSIASAPTPPDRVGEEVGRELLDLAASFDQSGKTLISPEQYPVGHVQGWKEAHACCARDLRTLAAKIASAPSPDPAGAGGDLGELGQKLRMIADHGFACASFNSAECKAILGKLVASTGSGEETKGEPSGTGYSSETTPSGRGPAGEYPSRGWQPISTAPKDGKPILAVWAGYVPVCAHWLPEHERWLTFAPDEFDSKKDLEDHLAATMYKPTHWMPLPEGPALGTEARSAETFGLGPKDDGPADLSATPEATPQQSPSPTTETDPPTLSFGPGCYDFASSVASKVAALPWAWAETGDAQDDRYSDVQMIVDAELRSLAPSDAPSTTEADR